MTVPLDSATCLAVAERIGQEIATAAVWSGDRCNWVGAMPEEDQDGRVTVATRPLEADLYGGTAGVGLFLAELASITGDEGLRLTARGALRHAVSRTDDIYPGVELGLYAGRPGVAMALALAARALEEPALDGAARTIADGLPRLGKPLESDLMSGSAGAIVGLLALRGLLDDDRMVESAIHHGEDLLGKAQRSGQAMSWLSPGLRGAPPLTGLPHGAAGVAVALLELFAVTGTEGFRAGAEAAFAYERDLYDPVAGNWPDLRRDGNSPSEARQSFATFWCHGAPGGALARVRALELGADDSLRQEAMAGLLTTEQWILDALRSGTGDYSLCHGLAGNAEVLLEAAAVSPALVARAHETATAGFEAYHASPAAWPPGARGGATPSLFLGLAGIGRFYLRLAEPRLPSLMVIRPDRCAVSTVTPALPTASD